jgi:hypothetical protein
MRYVARNFAETVYRRAIHETRWSGFEECKRLGDKRQLVDLGRSSRSDRAYDVVKLMDR